GTVHSLRRALAATPRGGRPDAGGVGRARGPDRQQRRRARARRTAAI
ncbi:MAG: hypothetical protein AVDCRST_MAG88-1200, partial [uncultured Thermomicrobiales bacterium]